MILSFAIPTWIALILSLWFKLKRLSNVHLAQVAQQCRSEFLKKKTVVFYKVVKAVFNVNKTLQHKEISIG